MSLKRPFYSIGDILEKILSRHKWNSKLKQYSFFNQWEAMVGTEIAKHATPKIWQGSVLVVEVSNSSWLQELRMMECELLAKISTHSPDIKIDKIRWLIASQIPKQKSC